MRKLVERGSSCELPCHVVAAWVNGEPLVSTRRRGRRLTGSAPPPRPSSLNWFHPARNTTRWQYQLSDTAGIQVIDGVNLYIIDLDIAATAMPLLKPAGSGVHVICYFSAGTYEPDRKEQDAMRGVNAIFYPADWKGVLGTRMSIWNERWVDIRSEKVRSIVKRRLRFAAAIGCDGVDPDNVDAYSNRSGFKLTSQNQVSAGSRTHSLS